MITMRSLTVLCFEVAHLGQSLEMFGKLLNNQAIRQMLREFPGIRPVNARNTQSLSYTYLLG